MFRTLDEKLKVYMEYYQSAKDAYKKEIDDYKKIYTETAPQLAEAIEKSKKKFNDGIRETREKLTKDIDEAIEKANEKIANYIAKPITSDDKATLEMLENMADDLSLDDLMAMREKYKDNYIADSKISQLINKKHPEKPVTPEINIEKIRGDLKDYEERAKDIVMNYRGGMYDNVANYDKIAFISKNMGESISAELEKIPTTEDK